MSPSIAGGMWRALLLLAVAAVDAGGLRLKFAFTAVRNSGHSSQAVDISLSELVVRDAGLNVLTIAFISGHHNAEHPKGEGPAALIDGDNATKWIDLNFAQNGDEAYLIVEMQEGQLEPAAFELFTNLQVAPRAPLHCSPLPTPLLCSPSRQSSLASWRCPAADVCARPTPRRASRAAIRSTSLCTRRMTA